MRCSNEWWCGKHMTVSNGATHASLTLLLIYTSHLQAANKWLAQMPTTCSEFMPTAKRKLLCAHLGRWGWLYTQLKQDGCSWSQETRVLIRRMQKPILTLPISWEETDCPQEQPGTPGPPVPSTRLHSVYYLIFFPFWLIYCLFSPMILSHSYNRNAKSNTLHILNTDYISE